jgi:hypothetical protein
MRGEKIWNQLLFLIVIFRFSLGKAEMNIPRLCELRKDCLICIGQGATVFVAFPIVNEMKFNAQY